MLKYYSIFQEKFGCQIKFGIEYEFYFIPCSAEFDLASFFKAFEKSFPEFIIKPEKGKYQFELISIPFLNPNALIIKFNQFKESLKVAAQKIQATYLELAVPFEHQPSSGLHVNLSITDFEFFTQNLENIIGGLYHNLLATLIYFAPFEENYLRFTRKEMENPSTLSWGRNNRSVAIRIPVSQREPKLFRIEHRVASPNAKLEQVLAAIIFAIINGIERAIKPPQAVYGIAHLEQYNPIFLPTSLTEAKLINKKAKIKL
ncbi:type I glutamate--ammonia ligase [Rickettsiales endosymbiont of Stachyamoeba lipophora]|uniref:hypothetical protein n=1 Tax=Rickettsiales endosymbiont of Stachyamoeba lipophora TaxID=2486578 RepID=UPI0013DDABE2|nr:hypothetical protein [Rickettsiales endosymbiont of Stachyamoeba lipophora]